MTSTRKRGIVLGSVKPLKESNTSPIDQNIISNGSVRKKSSTVSLKTAIATLVITNLFVFQACQLLNQATPTISNLSSSRSSDPVSGYRLAFEQSFGFFRDIPDQQWREFYQVPAATARHYRIQHGDPNQGVKYPAQWNFFNWDPVFTCPHVQKLGGLGSGGKWTCDIERIPRVVQERRNHAITKGGDPSTANW